MNYQNIFEVFFKKVLLFPCMRFMAICERTWQKILIFALLFCIRGSYEKNWTFIRQNDFLFMWVLLSLYVFNLKSIYTLIIWNVSLGNIETYENNSNE